MKALALLSGGLDGLLAARLMADQGIEVEAVHFTTGFLRASRTRAAAASDFPRAEIADVAREYFERVVVAPKYGYGCAMAPCIDCRIFMLRKADAIARDKEAGIVITGEVLGQSRMSQRRESLDRIEHESGLAGRLLRPLSARHLVPTAAESDGRIARDRLESIHGRSRAAQLELARRFGIPQPRFTGGGCCLLSDAGFSRRLKDHLDHEGPAWPGAEPLARLRLGRHFRLSHALKVVVARNDDDGLELAAVAGESWVCRCVGGGALTVVEGSAREEGLSRAAALAARYSAGRDLPLAEVVCRRGPEERCVAVVPERDPGRFLI